MRQTMTVGVLVAVLAIGCSKGNEEGAAPKGAAMDDKAKPAGAAPAMEWKKLDVLGGLQIEVPGKAEISDASADAPGVSIYSDACSLKVNQTTEAYTDDLDKAKAEAEKDPGKKFKAWTKAEKTADGWVLAWTATGMSGSELHAVQVRRKIGDKQYECWESSDSAAKAECVIKACEGLKQ